MSDPIPPFPESDPINVRALANAVRFFFFIIAFGLSCVSLVAGQLIANFEVIFRDMLGGKPLPVVTSVVVGNQEFFIGFSLLTAALSIASLFHRKVVLTIYALGALGLVAVAETNVIVTALFLPLVSIIKQMGAGQ